MANQRFDLNYQLDMPVSHKGALSQMQMAETRRQKEGAVQDPLFQAELKTAAEHLNAQSD